MKLNRLVYLFLVFAFVLSACGGVEQSVEHSSEESSEQIDVAPMKGGIAPDFELKDISGQTVRLSDFRGLPVMVNFWATWCAPCLAEMPAIESRFQKYEGELVVLAVNFDEPLDLVQEFTFELGLSFDPLLDPGGEVQDLYQVRGYPSSYFVDPEGVIQIIHIGLLHEDVLDQYLLDIGLN